MTRQERDAFILWHEHRMHECGYPLEVWRELSRARDRWLAGAK